MKKGIKGEVVRPPSHLTTLVKWKDGWVVGFFFFEVSKEWQIR